MKKIFLILLLVGISTTISAVVVQTIYLKNGSVLYGYIERQDTKGNLTIKTDKAEVCLKDARYATKQDTLMGTFLYKDVAINERVIDESSLETKWKEWAEANDAFVMNSGKRNLALSDVTFVGFAKSAHDVRILERGTHLKYLEMTPNSYNVIWKDIKAIRGEKRKVTELSGINRVYQTKNGNSFEGEFAEETDNSLGLYVNGIIQSFDMNDVVKYSFKAINPDQSLFEQSPLIEIVCGKNGTELRGIIIEQNYMSPKNSENYVLVQHESGGIQSMKMSDIVETRRVLNDKYAPKYDIILKEGQYLVNRNNVHSVPVSEKEGVLVIDSINKRLVIESKALPQKITVEYRNNETSNVEVFQLVPLKERTLKKIKKQTFSYKDLVAVDSRATTMEKSKNRTSKAVFNAPRVGLYALYDSRNNKAIVLEIK